MKLKNIDSFKWGRVYLLRFDDIIFHKAEKIDDGLFVDFADFSMDSVLQSIEVLNLVAPCINCLLQSSPVVLNRP